MIAQNKLHFTRMKNEGAPLLGEFTGRRTPQDETAGFRRACAGRLSATYDDIVTLEDQAAERGIDAVQDDLIASVDLCREPAHGIA
jgi:hypothetical protein